MAPPLPATPAPEIEPVEHPITPEAEVWRVMTPAQRDAFFDQAEAAIEAERLAMPEGRPHGRARMGITSTLEGHFQRAGRRIYLASDLPVYYPGERAISPDLIAVVDVEDPGDDDQRRCWAVTTEGKGVDLALEILHHGDRQKDLVQNVITFARLGIQEYFVYDRAKQRVLGYRLLKAGMRYEPIPLRTGRVHSEVLGLDLVISGGRLRFYAVGSLVPETSELLDRANSLIDETQGRLEAAEAALEAAEAARLAAEQRAEAEAMARAEAEAGRLAAEARAGALEAELAALRARLGSGG